MTAIKKIHYGFLFLGMLLLCVASPAVAQNIPERPTPARFVNDFANMMSAQEVEQLERKLSAYDQQTSTQIAIVTIGSLKAYDAGSIEDLSIAWARKWAIGQKGKNNGLLIIVSKNDRKMRIETGYGTEGAIPDLMAKQIIDDQLKPNFKQENYYKGFDEATDRIMKLLAQEFSKEPDPTVEANEEVDMIWVIVFLLIVLSVIGGFFYLIYWIYKKISGHNHKKRFLHVTTWLSDDDLWTDLTDNYMPEMVLQKRKALQDECVLLSDSYQNRKEVERIYEELIDIRHAGYRYFKERNDTKLKQALKKLNEYAKDPIYDKESIADMRRGLMEEIAYFKPLSVIEELSDDDTKRLHQANMHYGKLIAKPNEVLSFNLPHLLKEIAGTLDDGSFWNSFKQEYTTDSIEDTRRDFRKDFNRIKQLPNEQIQGQQLYRFLTEEIELIKRSPHRFLKKKYTPPPTYTSNTTVFTSSFGGGGSSWGSSGSDSDSSWSSGSDFGGGDFGGGGSSGDW